MSFTANKKIDICQILQITPFALDAQIAFLGGRLTTEKETAVIAEIGKWLTGGFGNKFTSIKPNLKNFGVSVEPERKKNDIRSNIAVILEIEDLSFSLSQTFLERG